MIWSTKRWSGSACLDFRKRQIGELSGGQKKRVFLARALAQEGQVILLDEPFTGVDVTTEEAIIALFARTARRRPRHAGLDAQSRLGPRILRPHRAGQGRTCPRRRPDERSLHRPNLEAAFGGVLRHFVLGGAGAARRRGRRQV
jgi:manganese/iron transport system ATP-binding protein